MTLETNLNRPRELDARLLRLFPVSLLKSHFDKNGLRDRVIQEIGDQVTRDHLHDFALQWSPITRQHAHLFERPTRVPSELSFEGIEVAVQREEQRDQCRVVYLLAVADYEVVVGEPLESLTIKFLWPWRVNICPAAVIVYTTILEKDVGSYLPGNRPLVSARLLNDEDAMIRGLGEALSRGRPLTQLNLNRGIKRMWELNIIDSQYVRFLKARSTSTEAMDEEYLLRVEYPDIFTDLLERPLERTVFRVLQNNNPQRLVKKFGAEPTVGKLMFNTFPPSEVSIGNTVDEILRRN